MKHPAPRSSGKATLIADQVREIVARTPVIDIHTHLYDPAFGELLLWGIDELLVYHYLIAESFRYSDLSYDSFWSLSKTERAEQVWNALFVDHSPISESCRGVITTLNALGLEARKRDLKAIRKWFAAQKPDAYVSRCLELAGVQKIYMTNSPFDDLECRRWKKGFRRDDRFVAALRIDPLLLAWTEVAPKLKRWGYEVSSDFTAKTISEIRRFLADWTKRMDAQYLMVSLPPDWEFPSSDCGSRILVDAVLPHCRETGLPFAMMPGVRRAVNPQLQLAGDGVGLTNLQSLGNLCATHPGNKFLTTVLARENQHELCVLARKFRNLHIFGCWWFMNIPSIIEEMTRMRVELLGFSFTAQHSDARVLDQVIYKWQHSKDIIARVLTEKYADLASVGWEPTRAEVQRDIQGLFGGNFQEFCRR
jgi:hypothetical protein